MAYAGIYLIVIVYFSFQKNECKKPRKWRDSIYRFRGPRQSGLWVTCEVFGFRKISMWTNLKKKTRGRFLLQVKEISWRYNICNVDSWTLSWSGWWKEKKQFDPWSHGSGGRLSKFTMNILLRRETLLPSIFRILWNKKTAWTFLWY